jgi:hypothetical protein
MINRRQPDGHNEFQLMRLKLNTKRFFSSPPRSTRTTKEVVAVLLMEGEKRPETITQCRNQDEGESNSHYFLVKSYRYEKYYTE